MASLQSDYTRVYPQVNIPFDLFNKYSSFLKKNRLNLEIYFGSRMFDSVTRSDIIRLKNKLDYNPQLTLHAPYMDLSPGAVDSKVRQITIERFTDVLDFAEILKPIVIVFHSGYDRKRYGDRMDIWLEGSLETWRPINKRAAEMGIKIAIENVFEDEPENLRLLVEEMDSKNFGLCFDTGHFNMFSKLPLSEWLGLIRPYIIELHLHDNSRYADQHLAIGDGDFDFTTLFRELKGIDCVYTIEAQTVEGVKKSLERLKEYLK